MATMTSSLLSGAVDETVTEVAFATLFEEAMLWPTLYTVRQSSGPREKSQSFGELGSYQAKSESAEATEDQIVQQFQKTFSHTAYAKVIKLSREIIDDEDWGLVEDLGMQLGQKASETMEERAAALFNDATAGSEFTGEDGLPLASNAHVNADSGNSQDNNDTQSLSYSGLYTSRKNMRNFTGYESGQTLNVIGDEILAPVELEEEGFQLVEATLKPGSANNDKNFFEGRYTLYVWPWLTDTNMWFLMASRQRKLYLRWYQRVALEIMSDASFSQGVRKIGGYMRFSNGFTNWRFCYVNNPS